MGTLNNLLLSFTWLLASTLVWGEEELLTKKAALVLLKQSGYRWHQANTLKDEAEGKAQQASSALLPHVGAYMRQYGGKINPVQYGFPDPGNLSWFAAGTVGLEFGYAVIDLASSARLDAARENQKTSDAVIEGHRSDLIYLMLGQFLNVQRLQKSAEVVDATILRDQEILQLAKTRLNSGLAVKLDLNRAQGLLEKDKLKKLDTKIALFKSCKELGVTLSQRPFSCNLGPIRFVLLLGQFLENLNPNLIQNHPNIVAAKSVQKAAENMHLFAKRSSYPKLLFYGELGTFGSQVAGIGGPVAGIAGAQISFPLFDGNLNSGKAQEEGAKAIQAEMQEKYIESEAQSQLEISVSQVKYAQEAVELSSRQIEIAQEELLFSQEKFKLGTATDLEMSNAQVNLAAAYDLNVQAVFAYEVAKVSFFKASGNINQYFEQE